MLKSRRFHKRIVSKISCSNFTNSL